MLWGIITPLTIYGVWPVLLTAPLCGNHNQFTMLYFALSSLYFHHIFHPFFLFAPFICLGKKRQKRHEILDNNQFYIFCSIQLSH